ncbi:MAG: hypothetical protein U0U67_07005 [Chitinophagales bacterium]
MIILVKYIDAIIPFVIGIMLLLRPSLFTKSTGETREKTISKLKKIGFLLIVIGIIYSIIKCFSE